ncbi:hypothetical protein [Agarilytica rhodophyticola]|uniref:hypothetical protein n=1 Tax=Agarilytica rhodophyticola TaxID=1737490 RepID=UPI000B34A0D1|nr:hypothetical protein [Agarilytica rhodophyticola]
MPAKSTLPDLSKHIFKAFMVIVTFILLTYFYVHRSVSEVLEDEVVYTKCDKPVRFRSPDNGYVTINGPCYAYTKLGYRVHLEGKKYVRNGEFIRFNIVRSLSFEGYKYFYMDRAL